MKPVGRDRFCEYIKEYQFKPYYLMGGGKCDEDWKRWNEFIKKLTKESEAEK